MSCTNCGKEHQPFVGAICTGVGTWYLARVRREGHRLYEPVGKRTASYGLAIRRMAKAFSAGNYKRGDVIMGAEYYDPEQMCELVSR